MAPQLLAAGKVVVGLGANCPGAWGIPAQTIAQALGEIERRNIAVLDASPLYQTAAVGSARQPPYVNAVALLDTTLPPEALLRVFKEIERRSGRRGGRPWGPRSLDIDIVDYGGMVRHWRGGHPQFQRAGARPLILPHPLAHQRPFVLKPLLDIAPDWRHPALKVSARDLWHRLSRQGQGRVLRPLVAPARPETDGEKRS